MTKLLAVYLIFFVLFSKTNGAFTCPGDSTAKIPEKCSQCFDFITKQIVLKTTTLDKKVMWGFAMEMGNQALTWVKQRVAAGNKAVPSMCEIGQVVKDYAMDNLDPLVKCATQYNKATVTALAIDAPAALLIVATNQINITSIANGLICAVLDCLKPAYKNQFVPKYKKWVTALDKTTIQNNICALCTQYLQTKALMQSCFNNVKARTTVKVLQTLYDKFIPKYAGMYQTYRDQSLVACQTKSTSCGCNIDITDAINAGTNVLTGK